VYKEHIVHRERHDYKVSKLCCKEINTTWSSYTVKYPKVYEHFEMNNLVSQNFTFFLQTFLTSLECEATFFSQ